MPEAANIEHVPLYPDARACRRPATEHILRLFSLAERVTVWVDCAAVRVFAPELTELQRQVLRLPGMPPSVFLDKN